MEFTKTKQALLVLQQMLYCANCNQKNEELSSLGRCEHRFCRDCVDSHAGCPCPKCGIPSDVKNSSIDKRLSNVALLCTRMLEVIDGKSSPPSDKLQDCVIDITQPEVNEAGHENDVNTPIIERYKARSGRKRNSLISLNHESSTHKDDNRNDFVKIKHANQIVEHNSKTFVDDLPGIRTPNDSKKRAASSNLCQSVGKSERSDDVGERENYKSDGKLQTPKISPCRMSKTGNATPQSVGRKRSKGSANLDKRNAKGETLLQVAAIKMDIDEVKRLLDAGANPNVKDYAGWTPLHEAIGRGCTDIASLLISSGASVNTPGLDNETPLHDAVTNQHTDCVHLLITHGASVFARNSHGHTPLDIAQSDIKEILLTVSQSLGVDDELPLLDESHKPLCFTTSSLTKDQSKLLTKYCKEMQTKLVPDITAEVTHLITATNEKRTCSRTFKYLHALLAGKWIVDFKWLESCVANECPINEQDFQVTGSTTHATSNAPENARLNRLKQLPPLFDGCQFYFYGKPESSGLSKEQLITLVKQGGGSILTREPHIHNLDDYPYTHPYHAQNTPSLCDCTIYKIYDDNNRITPTTVQSQRMSSLPTSWLIDSIVMFSILDKSSYVVQ